MFNFFWFIKIDKKCFMIYTIFNKKNEAEIMMNFLTGNSIGVYFIIFFGKILEVSIATLRIVLINRGERTKGSLIAFVEVILWIFITGTVLVDFIGNPLKIVVFALAFSIGNYLGSWFESKLALGLSTIKVITSEDASMLIEILRQHNLAVTIVTAEGKDGNKKILEIYLKRNRIKSTVNLINQNISKCVITIYDIREIKGGYIKK